MPFGYNADFIDVLNKNAVYTQKIVGSTPVQLIVGTQPLTDRQAIIIQPINGNIYIGFNNIVSATTGWKLFNRQFILLPIGENIPVWAISDSGNVTVCIAELS